MAADKDFQIFTAQQHGPAGDRGLNRRQRVRLQMECQAIVLPRLSDDAAQVSLIYSLPTAENEGIFLICALKHVNSQFLFTQVVATDRCYWWTKRLKTHSFHYLMSLK